MYTVRSFINGKFIFAGEMFRISLVEVDSVSGVLPFAVFVNSVGIMGRISKELLNVKFRVNKRCVVEKAYYVLEAL